MAGVGNHFPLSLKVYIIIVIIIYLIYMYTAMKKVYIFTEICDYLARAG